MTGVPSDAIGEDWPRDWRFLSSRITETIATTRPGGEGDALEGADAGTGGTDGDAGAAAGDVNVAPMGVVSEPGEPTARARLWAGSDTRANVRATGRVTVHFTRDPLLYARAALSDDTDGFVADGRLADADAWVRCTAERVGEERDGEVALWRLEPTDGAVENRVVATVDRGFNAVVEACVDATRLHVDPDLRDRVARNLGLAWRCGGDRTREAAECISRLTDIDIRKKVS